ncbi:Ldh family oxidoreductase [Singulisphaera sp. PoT]|uniref:Ldh family oxidoreductase n=1 Tax=Singulisphaera sp. PoT TaxID=3411797 RepID=UPI003BF4E3B8
MSEAKRYRLEDLRRFAVALASAAGFPTSRASQLVGHLLWFDAAGAPNFGIESLPDWLDRLQRGEFDPSSVGFVTSETLGTVVLEGRSGAPPIVLARAGELAIEKARDAGIGLVRASHLAPTGPAAAIVSGMASGPTAAFAFGPDGQYALAIPAEEGPPAVFDSTLAADGESSRSRRTNRSAKTITPVALKPWMAALVPDGDWMILALRVDSIEPLSSFVERVGAMMDFATPAVGQLIPSVSEDRRQMIREQGMTLSTSTRGSLVEWARRLKVDATL